MFRQVSRVVVMALVVVGSLSVAIAAEPTPAPPKQITNSIGMKLTLVPSGEFLMGSKESAEETAAFFKKNYGEDSLKAGYFEGEHPQHRVRITKPFYLGSYHVTRGQFRKFVADTGYKTDPEKWIADEKEFCAKKRDTWQKGEFEQTDDHPVVYVSWYDAAEFCKWLSRKEGKAYRLPTEAEWEYACRAGTTTRYYSGDDPETLAKVGNVADATYKTKFPHWGGTTIKASDGYVFTSPVGSFKPNAFGLYDMHGNAGQWCSDWYDEEYYTASPADNPTGPDISDRRVLRGGSWGFGPSYACSDGRYGESPELRTAEWLAFLPGTMVVAVTGLIRSSITCWASRNSPLLQDEVQNPAALDVRTRSSAMGENAGVVAPGFFESIS